mgnify:CR=1 FL=1
MVAISKAIRTFFAAAMVAGFSVASASPALAEDGSSTVDASAAMVQPIAQSQFGVTGLAEGDAEFGNLLDSWKANDKSVVGHVAIPSRQPVDSIRMTSQYGYREDPFAGRRARHKGIDLAGPVGTPIYATADGIIGRAQWVNGYGNYVEINHGGGIQTRYGHMSKLIAKPNERVKRGQLIGLMGSTGRSTGSHLHYEVRVAGEPVNPMPFLSSGEYMLALKDRSNTAQGGPAE